MKLTEELESIALESSALNNLGNGDFSYRTRRMRRGYFYNLTIDEKIEFQQKQYDLCIKINNFERARKRMLILIFFMSQKLNRHF